MKGNFYKILCVILLVIVLILVAILTHSHFTDPGKPVWKDFELKDSTHVDTTKVHSNN
jgi:hypothetical protein